MRTIPVVMIMVGIILIWAAITARNPIEVVQAVLSGEDVPDAGTLMGGSLEETEGSGGTDTDPPIVEA